MDCVIIGGGIGGLTAAIALRQRGIPAQVVESAPVQREVGAGIWMPANAMQVLDRLGLAAAVKAQGAQVRCGEIRDVCAGRLQAIELGAVEREYGFGTVAIHRARLQRILASALPPGTVHLGRACISVSEVEDGVRLRFADGTEMTAAIVIAADGLRSAVRRQLFPESMTRYSGQTSYRGVACLRRESAGAADGLEIWGPGCRFGYSGIGEDEVYWFAVENAPAGQLDPSGTLLPRLRSRFAEFGSRVGELLANTGEEAVVRTDIHDLRPLPAWYHGRVALIGDAAHATTPNLGQGGAQAIEDAFVLADRVSAHRADPQRGFAEYQRIRKPKADQVVRTSWWLGRVAHVSNPAGRAARNAALRLMPPSLNQRQMRSLFHLNY